MTSNESRATIQLVEPKVRGTGKKVEKPEKPEKPRKAGKTEKAEKPNNAMKPTFPHKYYKKSTKNRRSW